MDESIIVYTKYYSEAVIEIIERYDLNIQIICLSSYSSVLAYLKSTPNVRGIIFLEYKVNRLNFKAYQRILKTADEISESSKQPFCVSIISNNDLPRKFVSQIDTSYIEILFTKFTFFNTDLLRFEGLAAVILNTIGVANQSILLTIDQEKETDYYSTSSLKSEFLKLCLDITITESDELEKFSKDVERFPEVKKLMRVRENSDMDEEYLESSEGLFKLFIEQGIARRKEDEAKINFRY